MSRPFLIEPIKKYVSPVKEQITGIFVLNFVTKQINYSFRK